MRRIMTSWSSLKSGIWNSRHHRTIRGVLSVMAVGGVVALAPVYAKDPVEPEGKPAGKAQPVRAESQSRVQNEAPALPECLTKLELSAQQSQQITAIIQDYDQSLGTVWNQFGQRYMQAIVMETSLLAAIEDNLSDDQRKQVRDQRHKTAQHERAMAATNAKPNQAKADPDEATTKPANAAEESLEVVSVSLTDEQEAAADRIQEKYRTQLRSLNRDIQGLHTRLVSLEADKLVEIEKVLTKDQLKQLRASRQNAPDAPKIVAEKAEATKSE